MSQESSGSDPLAAFGPNEWLVDELYQQYLKDRSSVDRAWWEFFEDYTPGEAAIPNGQRTAKPPAFTTAAFAGASQRRNMSRASSGSQSAIWRVEATMS